MMDNKINDFDFFDPPDILFDWINSSQKLDIGLSYLNSNYPFFDSDTSVFFRDINADLEMLGDFVFTNETNVFIIDLFSECGI